MKNIHASCETSKDIQVSADVSGADHVIWHMGDGNSFENTSSFTYRYKGAGRYNIQLIASDEVCVVTKEQSVSSSAFFVPNVITPNEDGMNDYLEIESFTTVDLKVYDRNGNLVYTAEPYQNNWNGAALPAGVYYYGVKISDQHFCKGWVHLIK